MYGGTITGNSVSGDGGGINVSADGRFAMYGGVISDNVARGNGGGVYVHSGGTLNFNEGAQIVNCDAVNGGGVCLENDAAVNLWNASIEGCRAIGGSGDDVWHHTITGDSRLDGKKLSSPCWPRVTSPASPPYHSMDPMPIPG